MTEHHLKVILGAYLHDMGKLLRRGGISRKNHRYQVAHAQYVADFFREEKYSDFWREVGLLASLHHARDLRAFKSWDQFSTPDEAKHIAWIIYMADNISSMERIDEEELEPSREEQIKNAGLRTVFENIFAGEQLTNKRSYLPQTLQETTFELTDKGISFEGAKFDAKIIGGVGDEKVKNGFKKLAQSFVQSLKSLALQYPNPTAREAKKLIAAIDILTQNYFTLVPSDAYKSIGDISLYDHTKTTVALASALYGSGYREEFYPHKTGNTPTQKVCREEISVIAGDFPSIQKYLFSSLKSQTHLAKRLRMRSMNIQLLNEAVVQYLLDQLQLSRANVLINAGGKFVILTPKMDDPAFFQRIKKSINDYFVQHYATSLKISLITQSTPIREIFDIQGESTDTKGYFESLFQKLSQEKFHIYDSEQLTQLFQTPSVAGKRLCKSCGLHYVAWEDEEAICQHCQEEIEGGRLITSQEGVYLRFQQEGSFAFQLSWSQPTPDQQSDFIFLTFNNWEYPQTLVPTFAKSINTHIPKNTKGEAKSFEEIVDNARGYLCMLKGDIDNMSILLKYGFEYGSSHTDANDASQQAKSIYSVSRLVQMSRMLDLFFGKYLMHYLQKEFPEVYTVFSGGDDFVFILPFQQRAKFIQSLYREFEAFVAYNQHLHFSIGLKLFKNKTPIALVDQQTEELLKQAKKASKLNLDREKLTVRGLGLYEKSYTLLKNDATFDLDQERNVPWAEQVSESLLYQRYLELFAMHELNPQTQSSEYVKRGARLLYSITRNVASKELKSQILDSLRPIQNPADKPKLRKILLQLTNILYQKRA